jgi:hypothetical protein
MAHKLVTTELVEKAFDAATNRTNGSHGVWFGDIRAALEAVVDDLIEACAKVAIEAGAYEDSRGIHAIRSLKSQGQ